MNKTVLFVSHTANFAKFNLPYMRWFQDQGWTVHYACGMDEPPPDCDRAFVLPFHRSPYSLQNIAVYRELKRLIERERYGIVHCHTPVGGVLARLAASRARKTGTKVIYTAHGFHFYSGAPLLNWLLFYPIEKFLARRTDCLITMNQEDGARAAARHFRAGRIERIDGVGVSLERFHPPQPGERSRLRGEFGLPENAFVLLCVAEFIPRKNHRLLLDCLPALKRELPALEVLLAGTGDLESAFQASCESEGLSSFVHFLGYRRDVERLYRAADLLISPSRQEGLPLNVIEGMASGLPMVCTAIRGQTDVIADPRNGLLVPSGDAQALRAAVLRLAREPDLRRRMGEANREDVRRYSLEHALGQMASIYRRYMEEAPRP